MSSITRTDSFRELPGLSKEAKLAKREKPQEAICPRCKKKIAPIVDKTPEIIVIDALKGIYMATTKMSLNNGRYYKGELIKNEASVLVPHGFGTVTYADGVTYTGEFVEGVIYSGQPYLNGVMLKDSTDRFPVFAKVKQRNGDIYEGWLLNGKYSGKATMTTKNGVYQVLHEKGELIDSKKI